MPDPDLALCEARSAWPPLPHPEQRLKRVIFLLIVPGQPPTREAEPPASGSRARHASGAFSRVCSPEIRSKKRSGLLPLTGKYLLSVKAQKDITGSRISLWLVIIIACVLP